MPNEVTIEEVVDRASSGDLAACHALYNHWFDAVHGYCTAFAQGDEDLASTLTTEAWVAIFAGLGHLQDIQQISDWLHATTRVTCIRMVERRLRQGRALATIPEPLFELVTTCPKRDLQAVAALVYDDQPCSLEEAALRLRMEQGVAAGRLGRFQAWARGQLVVRIAGLPK